MATYSRTFAPIRRQKAADYRARKQAQCTPAPSAPDEETQALYWYYEQDELTREHEARRRASPSK